MKHVQFTLPWPPTVNMYYRHVGLKVLISADGRAYRKRVGLEVMLQKVPRDVFSTRLSLAIIAEPPDRRVRDLDNLLKPTLDCLQATRVIENDSLIDQLTICRGPPRKEGGQLLITVSDAELWITVGNHAEREQWAKPLTAND